MINQTSQNNIYVVAESSLLATSVIESPSFSLKLTVEPLGLEYDFIVDNSSLVLGFSGGPEVTSLEVTSMLPEVNGTKIKVGFIATEEASHAVVWTVTQGDASIADSNVEVV
jgi:hypothetical protein